jgi:hypothetical protein
MAGRVMLLYHVNNGGFLLFLEYAKCDSCHNPIALRASPPTTEYWEEHSTIGRKECEREIK